MGQLLTLFGREPTSQIGRDLLQFDANRTTMCTTRRTEAESVLSKSFAASIIGRVVVYGFESMYAHSLGLPIVAMF